LNADELVVQIDTLSAKFENRLAPKKPWTSAKMTAARLEALKKGIVGFSMQVEDCEGSFKLNQQKSEADYAAVANGLAVMPDHGSQTIAQLMREARPQAFASTTNETASLEGSM
jgi:transcriptional regulator